MTLQSRLMCLALAALAPAIVLLGYNAWEERRERTQAVDGDAMRAARQVASDLENMLTGMRQLLAAVAVAPPVTAGDRAACSRYLAAVQHSYEGSLVIGASDQRGDVWCLSRPPTSGAALNNATRRYRNAAIDSNAFAVGDHAIGTSSGQPAIHFAYPIRDANDQPIGIVFAAMRLDWMATQLLRRPMPANATLTVSDRNGTILVRSPESELVGQALSDNARALVARGGAGTVVAPGLVDRQERIIGYMPVAAGADTLVAWVGLAPADALAAVTRSTWRTVLIGSLSIALALALAWVVGRVTILRPLHALDRIARRWSSGDLSARTGLTGRHDEFARLGQVFDALAQTLQQREAERDDAEHALRRSRDEAMRASAAKTSFLAAASHDLRQPLQAMTMATSLLAIRHRDDADTPTISRLRRSVSSLANLLDSLLDVSQLDAGLVRPRISDFAVGPLLETIGEEFADPANAKGLTLSVESSNATVRSDIALLGRMVRNLVSNAIKYTDTGAVTLSCAMREGRIEIEVTDTGIGIPASQHQSVFEDFHQLHNPERDRSKGLGLGLAIVHRMSVLLEHPVRLQSRPGTGSTFTISVPLGDSVEPAADGVLALRFRGRVLLVEDDPMVAESTAAVLGACGLQVEVSGSAEDALARIDAASAAYDAVFADYRLPGMTGLQVIHWARMRWPNVLSIIVTGDVGNERLQQLTNSGIAVAAKPLRIEHLAELLAPLGADAAVRTLRTTSAARSG